MGKHVAWCVELAVNAGQLRSFMELTAEMVESTRNEPGVLSYERFVADDGQLVHAYERYADSASALAHLQTFREMYAARFLAMVHRVRFTVYGSPSAALKELLDGFDAIYLRRFGDFEYWP